MELIGGANLSAAQIYSVSWVFKAMFFLLFYESRIFESLSFTCESDFEKIQCLHSKGFEQYGVRCSLNVDMRCTAFGLLVIADKSFTELLLQLQLCTESNINTKDL